MNYVIVDFIMDVIIDFIIDYYTNVDVIFGVNLIRAKMDMVARKRKTHFSGKLNNFFHEKNV